MAKRKCLDLRSKRQVPIVLQRRMVRAYKRGLSMRAAAASCGGSLKACRNALLRLAPKSIREKGKVFPGREHFNWRQLSGQEFGDLTVVRKWSWRRIAGRKLTAWLCRCRCGTTIIVEGRYLPLKGSCGCAEPLKIRAATLDYLAALIDGEGCLSLAKAHRDTTIGHGYVPSLTIRMCAPSLLRSLCAECGIGFVCAHPSKNPKWRGSTSWTIGAADCRRLLPLLIGRLRLKHRQARLLYRFIMAKVKYGPARFASRMAWEDAIYCSMRRLNRKGPRNGRRL